MINSRKFLYTLEERVVEYYKESKLSISKGSRILLSTVPTIPIEGVENGSLILFGCVLFLGTMGMLARVIRGRHGSIRHAAGSSRIPHEPFPTSVQYEQVGVGITEFSPQITSDELSENTRRAMELTQSVVSINRPPIPDTFKSVVRKRTPALDSVPVDVTPPNEDVVESSFIGEVGSKTREVVSTMKITEWVFEKGSAAWEYVTNL